MVYLQDLGDNKYKYTLTFGEVRPEDFHRYTLQVTNSVGTQKATFTVEEQIGKLIQIEFINYFI